jgi:hypothetical protein
VLVFDTNALSLRRLQCMMEALTGVAADTLYVNKLNFYTTVYSHSPVHVR